MKFQSEAQRRRYEEDYRPAYNALMKCYPFELDAISDEVWQPIAGYDEFYHVSNYGRIKSFQRYRAGKILTPALNQNGYLRVNLHFDGERKDFSVHVLVARAFIPNPDNKPEVNHRVGCKFNCHVSNLEWSTHAENIQHAVDNGLHVAKKGEEHPLAKLKDEQIILYIRNNPDGLTGSQLAEKCGVDKGTISAIQLGKEWQHVGGNIRKAKPQKYTPRVSDEIRAQIRADWATGKFSINALAKKYDYGWNTIRRIINESN